MPEPKVIRFPGSDIALHAECNADSDVQLALFGHGNDDSGRIVFLDIRWLVEETLLSLVVRNSITSLVDIRLRPVFDRPHFIHKKIVSYLYERNVLYCEYALLTRGQTEGPNHCSASPIGAQQQFNHLLTKGLTLCLYDETAKTAGWLDEVRQLVNLAPSYRAEVNPRALLGFSPGMIGATRA